MIDSNTSPGSDCKFFEEWDRDLGFLVMPRVVLLSLPVPPTSAPSLLSHILHFCCPELLLSAHKALSFITCHHLWETQMTAYLTARQAVSLSVRLTEFRFSDMGTDVLGKGTLPQLQDLAWP